LALKSGKYSFYGSFNNLLPQLNLSNSYNASNGSNALFRTNHYWNAQATANMNVFNMSAIAAVRTSRAALTLAESRLAANVFQRASESSRRFHTAPLCAGKASPSPNTSSACGEKSAQMLVLRYNAGQESKGNMMRSKAQALQAQTALAQALRDLRADQKTLARQLGWDDFALMTATGTLDTQVPPKELPESFAPLLLQRRMSRSRRPRSNPPGRL